MTVVVTHTTPADSTFSSTGAAAWNADHALSGVGTMAEQNANNVAITGGTINNTTIGATTPSTGVFTTLTAQTEVLKGTGQNLVFQSQAYNNATWSQSTVTRLDNQTTAPDGSSTAGTITSVNSAYGGLLRQTPVTTASTYTMSAYVKKNNWSYVGLRLGSLVGAGDKYAYFNFDTLATSTNAISGATFTATSVGNGWYRLVLSGLIAANAGSAFDVAVVASDGASATNNGAGQIVYVWGVQLELGSVANTYIPTTTSQIYGTPTLSFSGVASIGLQSDGSLYETSAGTGNVRFYTNNIGQEQMRVSHTASAVNYVQVTGGATTKAVIQSAQGSDSNISYVTQSKGTGAIDLAAGSSGVNISNGGTVTALTTTANGSYTSAPSIAVSAPTTAGGVQSVIAITTMTPTGTIAISSGGTGYTAGDVLTVSGGTLSSGTTQITVSTVSAGVITAATVSSFGVYSVLPSNPASVTGGTGSSATFTLNYRLFGALSITTAGSGYVEQPTVTFSGGGGSGAGAYATVGSIPRLTSIGSGLEFAAASGVALRVANSGTANVNFYNVQGNSSGGSALLAASGADTDVSAAISSRGAGSVRLQTNNSAQEQLRVTHTASAVNYVQVTGAATGGATNISTQGSDSSITANYSSKGPFSQHIFLINGYTSFQVSASNGVVVNRLSAQASLAGAAPVLQATGTDTNIPLVLQPKGTGALQAQQTDSTATGGNARGANAVDWQTSRDTASKVASGQLSIVGGGYGNLASGFASVSIGGQSNTVSSSYGVVAGYQNTVTGPFSSSLSGQLNTAAGYYNFIGGGFTNSGTANAVVTTQSATMNGTTAVTLSGSNASIKVGQYIAGTSIAADTYVAAISGTSLTLSKVASGSSTSTLSFFTPHGVVVGGGNNQATGAYSAILGGGDAGTAANRNVASGDWSTVGGGIKNTASGVGSFVGGGGFNTASIVPNTASGILSSILGGGNNTASSNYSSVVGYQSTANGTFSSCFGAYGSTRGITGNMVFSPSFAPISSTAGTQQTALLVLGKQTTDATATVLTCDGSAAGTTNQVILPNNSAYYFKGSVIANVTGGGNTKAWAIEGAIKRGANAASTALVGTPTVTSAYADVGAATWAITATADTTNGGLAITFTGQAGTTIRVVAKLETTEVTF